MMTAEQARAKVDEVKRKQEELKDIEKKINNAVMMGMYWCDVKVEELCETNIEVLESLGYVIQKKSGDTYGRYNPKSYTIMWRK